MNHQNCCNVSNCPAPKFAVRLESLGALSHKALPRVLRRQGQGLLDPLPHWCLVREAAF